MRHRLSSLSFLRAFSDPGDLAAALRPLVDTALVLPCDLTEAEREET